MSRKQALSPSLHEEKKKGGWGGDREQIPFQGILPSPEPEAPRSLALHALALFNLRADKHKRPNRIYLFFPNDLRA